MLREPHPSSTIEKQALGSTLPLIAIQHCNLGRHFEGLIRASKLDRALDHQIWVLWLSVQAPTILARIRVVHFFSKHGDAIDVARLSSVHSGAPDLALSVPFAVAESCESEEGDASNRYADR